MTTLSPAQGEPNGRAAPRPLGHEQCQRETCVVCCLMLKPHFIPSSTMQIERMHLGCLDLRFGRGSAL
jgi:hypothetical protein